MSDVQIGDRVGGSGEQDIIPELCRDALAMWDRGDAVFSVEMGGLGPGYEMAIQGLIFEFIREGLKERWDWNEETTPAIASKAWDQVAHACNERPWGGGFSGAQVGAAKNMAAVTLRKGYRAALRDPAVKDRLIQVCKKDLRGA